VKGYTAVTLIAARYGSGRLNYEQQHGKTEMIIMHEVFHLPGTFNLISQSLIREKDVQVEPVNQYGLNLDNPHAKLIATATQVDGLFVLDQAWESTKYAHTKESRLLALRMTGHASRCDSGKWMLWHRLLPHIGLKALDIWPTFTNALRMTGKCDCGSCI
jgi:hypothetical protein